MKDKITPEGYAGSDTGTMGEQMKKVSDKVVEKLLKEVYEKDGLCPIERFPLK